MVSASAASLLDEGFRDLEPVGRGGHGSVFRGTDIDLGRVVAVKVLHSGTPGDDDRAVKEARAQAAVSHHDNVLTLHRTGSTSEGHPFLVLEFAAGGSLDDRIERDGHLDSSSWHRLGAELATALAAARTEGVAHCDVKPSNVLFTAEGAVRLADFGIARSVGTTADTLDHFRGSIAYTAPEILDGEPPGFAGDVYSLALTLWFAAMGRHPFGADRAAPASLVARIQTERIDFDDLPFPVASDLRRSLERGAQREPADRPDPATLAALFRHRPMVVATEDRRPRRRWTVPVVALVAASAGSLSTLLVVPASTAELDRRTVAPAKIQDRFCTAYEETMALRTDLLADVSDELEQSASPSRVVQRVLQGYPEESAAILLPFVQEWRRFSGERAPEMSRFTLSQLSLAEALRPLTGGKVFLNDSEDGSFDPRTLPTQLRVPALTLSDAFRSATESCGPAGVDLDGEKARMSSAVFSTLTDDRFLEDFFEDPDSAQLMTTPTVLLITSMSWGFTEALLVSHLEWFFGILEADDELLSAVAFEHPDIILAAVLNEPALASYVTTARWSAHLRLGFDHATPSEKVGMRQLYGAQLQMIGVADA